ncbi:MULTISPECIES: DUF4435 domain-containing protein [Vibrio]|uniref:DUF4435 domain-containing protein n=1 Tax=Vibrio TaxID=662 RepID=UPI001CDB9073|nr:MULTISPECIES: DUF4435 domain-containing protein [Vibrio]EJG0025916.1 DUF4435 domain-containing protein [Vibrio alginolyticus]ELA7356067.1 DUF4435 domain-containing protein [Vibrio alginolyticus]MCA2487105.1 DUF4435 domain-containing protein [Vibrio alginolyticus]MCG6239149.1 DUF4435 domain-containing protein [Vibrio diabolicus]MDW1779838.1 DUF4435 domain-containing protein [Vibrio sp. Vb2134]
MNVEQNVPDFEFDDDLEESQAAFGEPPQVTAFVEGFDDCYFWGGVFEQAGIDGIAVEAVCCEGKANGKSTLLKAISEERITLGRYNLVCIDSDYDNIFGLNQELYRNEFCFQTYAYSIENYYYQPRGLFEECCRATLSRKPDGVGIPCLIQAVEGWSQEYYETFCYHLFSKDSESANVLVNKISLNGVIANEFNYALSAPQKELLEELGIFSNSIHFFIRGHNFESKMSELSKEVTSLLSKKKVDKISKAFEGDGKKAGKFIQEYMKKQTKIDELIIGRDFPKDNRCYERILDDVSSFKNKYCSI